VGNDEPVGPAFRPGALTAHETQPPFGDPRTEADVRHEIGAILHKEVAAMNLDNFVVRPRRRIVEKYSKPSAWTAPRPRL
jgi:hypothetical protein